MKILFYIFKLLLLCIFIYHLTIIIINSQDFYYNPYFYITTIILILILINKKGIYKIIIALIAVFAIFTGLPYLSFFLEYDEFHPSKNEVYLHVIKEIFYIILIILYYLLQNVLDKDKKK